jgi:hypothetical protein
MKCRLLFIAATVLLSISPGTFAQQGVVSSSADVAFWVVYWGRPKAILFGPEEEAFNRSVHEVMFSWNEHDGTTNPSALDDTVQWLKDHPSVRFYVDGYASSRGDLIYNLALSQRRADWVKQTLISKGIPENRIVMAVVWGQLYPVCPELSEECWGRNRLVRFTYSPK